MENLRHIREARGLQAKEIAEKLGLSPAAISQYENGIREPSIEIMKKISHILNCSIDELVGNTEKED